MPGSATTRERILIWLGIPLFVIVIIVGGSALVWEVRTIALLENQIASLARENGQLLRRIADLTRGQPAAAPGQQPAQTQQTLSDLQNIFRRREMVLRHISQRFQEIITRYRASRGTAGSRNRETCPLSAAEISGIRDSLALVDDDLNEIAALDALAERLEGKLPVN